MIVIQNARLRSFLRILTLLLIPSVAVLGYFLLRGTGYVVTSVTVASLSVVLFLCGFDRRKTGSRRLVLVSVMIALSVLGRFFPLLKPVTAVAVITGVYLGMEAGFLTGAFSALISNFYYGQGPWTPFQMFAWGILAFLAGALARPLQKSRTLLCLYGALSGILYSLIMDIWSAVFASGGFSLPIYLAKVVTALPHTVLYAVSNVIFLFLMAKPFGEKLTRIKRKYGV
ncbi:MAG: ECF transporter S component [Clostridia bacterium]|nr:ECF transporter S component [Clostridia bacterium]